MVVLDQERLYNDLKKQFGDKVQIVHLPKSGGVSVETHQPIQSEWVWKSMHTTDKNGLCVSVIEKVVDCLDYILKPTVKSTT